MIIHVPTSALPHLRPALRLADPAQPVISLQGRRTPGAATRGRRAAPDPSAASARLGRPGGDGRADPAPAGKAASAGWSHPAPSCGGTIAWSPGRHGQAAAEMTSLAISVRELSTPCHLAQGLLDYAQYLTRTRDAEGAAAAIKEARAIAGRLRCQPLLDRAADIAPANPRCRIRSRRYLIWKSPPARPGSLRPQRPDYAGPDTSRMILMDRGFGRELLAHWDTGGTARCYQAIFVPSTALASPGYDGQPAVYLYIAALEVNIRICRVPRGAPRCWCVVTRQLVVTEVSRERPCAVVPRRGLWPRSRATTASCAP
jgi:hypothetical protein